MDGADQWHFKASLLCRIPSYNIDSGEVLRAIPAHLLRRRDYALNTASESCPVYKQYDKLRSFSPKRPSPLRQSSVLQESGMEIEDEDEEQECCDSTSLACTMKRNDSKPRLPQNDVSRGRITQARLRKIGATFVAAKKSSRKPLSDIMLPNASSRSGIAHVAHATISDANSSTEARKPENAADRVSAFQQELEKRREQIQQLRLRLTKLEQTEQRSEIIRRRVQERRRRLDSIESSLGMMRKGQCDSEPSPEPLECDWT